MLIPKQVIVETTEKCNLKCKGCYRDYSKHPFGGHMPDELFLSIIEQVAAMGHKPLILPFSHGEPTLHPRFVWHCKTISDAGLPFSISTNGTGDIAHLREAAERPGCERICYSLDGFYRETRRMFRPGSEPAAAQAMAMIEHGRALVSVSLLSQGQPWDEIQEFVQWWLSLGALIVIVRRPLSSDPLDAPLGGWQGCKYHHGYYLTIKSDGRVKLCERNVNSPVIGDANTQRLTKILDQDTAALGADYCPTCPQRYSGDTFYGSIESRAGEQYYVRQDYFNTIYSQSDLRWGVAWSEGGKA